jgi:hypothetical protein
MREGHFFEEDVREMFLTSTTDAYNTHTIPDKPTTLQIVAPCHAPPPRAKHGMGQGGEGGSYRDQLSVSEPVLHFYAFFMQHKMNALCGGHDYPVCDLASAPVLKLLYMKDFHQKLSGNSNFRSC